MTSSRLRWLQVLLNLGRLPAVRHIHVKMSKTKANSQDPRTTSKCKSACIPAYDHNLAVKRSDQKRLLTSKDPFAVAFCRTPFCGRLHGMLRSTRSFLQVCYIDVTLVVTWVTTFQAHQGIQSLGALDQVGQILTEKKETRSRFNRKNLFLQLIVRLSLTAYWEKPIAHNHKLLDSYTHSSNLGCKAPGLNYLYFFNSSQRGINASKTTFLSCAPSSSIFQPVCTLVVGTDAMGSPDLRNIQKKSPTKTIGRAFLFLTFGHKSTQFYKYMYFLNLLC
jgi:hypothetical protein